MMAARRLLVGLLLVGALAWANPQSNALAQGNVEYCLSIVAVALAEGKITPEEADHYTAVCIESDGHAAPGVAASIGARSQ